VITRRTLALAAACAALAPLSLHAQTDWRRVAVPFYSPRDVVIGHLREFALPRAITWQRACASLVDALSPPAAARRAAARAAWREAAITWSALAAVATGPLLTRRSARRVDFHPVRVPLIQRAIAQAPSGEQGMERVGSAAKGLGALEWLLWSREAGDDAATWAYALEMARDLQREADALVADHHAAIERRLDDAAVAAAFSEIVNQWISGLEQLRLQRLLRPVEEAASRGAQAPVAIRPLAGIDAAERRARWQALQSLAILGGAAAPARGGGALVPLETYLRGRGLNPLADRLRQSLERAGAAVGAAEGGTPQAMRRAARAVGAARHLAEADIAPALDVKIGFSDADGD
jgi:predicted lipoprotein